MTPDQQPGPVENIPGPGTIPGGLEVDIRRTGDECVASINGEVDIATASQLWERLESEIEAGTRRLVLELGRMGFIDSTGLTVIIRAHKRLTGAGAQLVLRSPAPAVARVLAVSGLDQVLDIEIDPG